LTLPLTANANRSNTSRIYSIKHIGATGGTITINPSSGDSIYDSSTLKLYKNGDRVLVHHHTLQGQCSVYDGDQSTCEATSGCTWNPGVTCSDYNGNQGDCENAGCTYSDPDCTGAGSSSSCSGVYTVGKYWFVHNYEKGLNYVEKTANYTLTEQDDIVNVTSNSITLTLPSAATYSYKKFTMKNTGAGVVTLNTTSGQTIDGNASGVLTLNTGDSIDVQSTATNWVIV
jgi:hypothetical protein